jgi:hypothetical protein
MNELAIFVVSACALTGVLGYWLGKRSVTNKLYNIIEPAFREGLEKRRVLHEPREPDSAAAAMAKGAGG